MENKPVKNKVVISLVVIAAFMATKYTSQFYWLLIPQQFKAMSLNASILLCGATDLALCFFATLYLAGFSFKKMLEMLGLNKGLGAGFLLALLAALPQLLGLQILHGFHHGVAFVDIWINGIHPGYREEIMFRGFLIGILARYAKWPAIIPLALSSALFAMGHLYQAHNFPESVTVFLVAFGGGTGFYLFYKYSNWNLWFPMFLHSFMDTSTVISNWDGNIMMSAQDNIFRGATLALAIFICIRVSKIAKRKAQPVENPA